MKQNAPTHRTQRRPQLNLLVIGEFLDLCRALADGLGNTWDVDILLDLPHNTTETVLRYAGLYSYSTGVSNQATPQDVINAMLAYLTLRLNPGLEITTFPPPSKLTDQP